MPNTDRKRRLTCAFPSLPLDFVIRIYSLAYIPLRERETETETEGQRQRQRQRDRDRETETQRDRNRDRENKQVSNWILTDRKTQRMYYN